MATLRLPVPEEYLKESSAELIVSRETKRLWAIQLDLLNKIDQICRKHGIRYSVDSGTLIGAARHRGYIPWDDDIDVVMLRKDFERFAAVVDVELDGYYFFQTADNSPGYYRPFARLLNTATSAMLASDMVCGKSIWSYRQCVFVDILIADNVPDDKQESLQHAATLKKLHDRYWRCRWDVACFTNLRRMQKSSFVLFRAIRGSLWALMKLIGISVLDRRYNRFLDELLRFKSLETEYVAPFSHRVYEVLRRDDFNNLIDFKFDFITVKGFARYDEILTSQYGDWHRHVIGPRPKMHYKLEGVSFHD